uniref:7TM_GPCR_Srx domain-containing protein n=1 Tax=Steinernema glaseri TaxID=37863 RepID=A0A1I7YWW3_9BILA
MILLTITRNLILIDAVTHCLPYLLYVVVQCTHLACLFGVMDAGVLIAGERLVATWIVDKYERVRNWWIAVGVCLLTV